MPVDMQMRWGRARYSGSIAVLLTSSYSNKPLWKDNRLLSFVLSLKLHVDESSFLVVFAFSYVSMAQNFAFDYMMPQISYYFN